ncbi:hypothetical protein UT300012_21590 [Paraclostridium bifermentans]
MRSFTRRCKDLEISKKALYEYCIRCDETRTLTIDISVFGFVILVGATHIDSILKYLIYITTMLCLISYKKLKPTITTSLEGSQTDIEFYFKYGKSRLSRDIALRNYSRLKGNFLKRINK